MEGGVQGPRKGDSSTETCLSEAADSTVQRRLGPQSGTTRELQSAGTCHLTRAALESDSSTGGGGGRRSETGRPTTP